MDRRTFLRSGVAAAAGAAGIVSLGGCNAGTDADGDGYDDETGEYLGAEADDEGEVDIDLHGTSRRSTSGSSSGRRSGSTSGRSSSGSSGRSSSSRR